MKLTEFFQIKSQLTLPLPLYLSHVSAGFPSPADDYVERTLDLNQHLIEHPAATYFVKASGNSMINAGIHSGDILIVDRSLTPKDKSIVIAALNGELTVKRLRKIKGKIQLLAENDQYQPIEIEEESSLEIWGVVIYVIHSLR